MAAMINSRDITERKAAEEAVRQSEEKFRLSFMTSMDAFYWSALEDGKIIDVNPVFEEMWGYSREEVIGRTSVELGLYQDPADRSRMVSELKEKGHVKDLELKGKRKDGRLITVSLSGNIMQINDQASILGVIRDITEKKLAGQQREILYQVLRAVSGQLETEVVARAAVETFVKLTGYPHVFIALPDENMTHWAVRSAAGSLAAELGATYPIHKGVIGNAFKTGQTQWVRDVLEDPHYVNDVKKPGGPALRSEFVALMRSGDNLLGALNVESDHADAFDDSDIWMIQSVADIISLALQNAKLFGEAEQEINVRKRAEQALLESEKRFRVIFEKANDGIIITRENNEIVEVNARMCALLGYSREEFLKLKIPDLQAPEVRQAGDVVKRELERHGDKLFEGVDIDRSGRRIPIEISAGRVELPSGEFFVSVIRDISERKQTQTLQEAVYRIAAAADTTRSLDDFYPQIHEIISSVMPARNFYITLYDEAQNMLRFPYFKDAEDKPMMGGLQPGKGLSAYVLRTGKSLLCTKAVHDELERQGEVKLLGVAPAIWLGVPLIVEGKPIGAMVLQHYTDPNAYGPREQHMLEYVSTQVAIAINRLRAEEEIRSLNTELEQRVVERTRDLRDAQDKIVRQEKLALLGQLAGGVGHELRNPLGIISNAIYYLKYIQPDAEEKVRQYHAMIEQEVRTSEKIINDLLDFARLDSVDREPVEVRELVQRTLTRFTVPESIKTTIRISEDLPKVLVDMSQMEQVLGNLTVNACQAMVSPRGTTPLDSPAGFTRGGELTISASRQKEMIAISVKDTGVGITPENIGKIFEPLFTTKPKGIGLGLAVSRKLAEANGGRIEVKSEPGKGSTFTLFLPVEIKS
jgi:PAS domain S-box-containing protein